MKPELSVSIFWNYTLSPSISLGFNILTKTFSAAFLRVELPLNSLSFFMTSMSIKFELPSYFFKHFSNHGCFSAFSPEILLALSTVSSFFIISRHSGVTFFNTESGNVNYPFYIFENTSALLLPSNGYFPVIIRYRTTPSDQRSHSLP